MKAAYRRTRKHPACGMTLREFSKAYYADNWAELAPHSRNWYRYMLDWWEKFSPNPPVGEITDETLEAFRQAMINAGRSANSINSSRTSIRALMRRAGPQFTGNPRGIGALERVPYMRACRVIRSRPKVVSQEDLSRFYLACRVVTRCINRVSGLYWWQALLVVAYFTGLRKTDLFKICIADVDLAKRELWHTATKTRKADVIPLHPVACHHIARILGDREFLFQSTMYTGGRWTRYWNRIIAEAKVSERFTLQSIRRTAASEVERVKTGMGPIFLQHVDRSVTATFYINRTEELGECIGKMRVPIAFSAGPKMAARQLENATREAQEMMRNARLAPAVTPEAHEWEFYNGGFRLRGISGPIRGANWRALKVLARAAEEGADVETLAEVIFTDKPKPDDRERLNNIVAGVVSRVRERLSRAFCLPFAFDPVLCIERGNGGRWRLYIPATLGTKGGAA